MRNTDLMQPLILHRASLMTQMVKNLPAMQETWVQSLDQGRSPGDGTGYPFQYSCLENSMDRGAWWVLWGCKELDTIGQLTHTYTHTHTHTHTKNVYAVMWENQGAQS